MKHWMLLTLLSATGGICIWQQPLCGQTIASAVYATAGSSVSAHGKLSYTIGETMVRTFDKYGYTLEEGFQRAFTAPVGEEPSTVQYAEEQTWNCFPNPASQFVYVEVQSGTGTGCTGAIRNTAGRSVCVFDVPAHIPVAVPLSNIPAGMYFITLQDADGIQLHTRSLVIVK